MQVKVIQNLNMIKKCERFVLFMLGK